MDDDTGQPNCWLASLSDNSTGVCMSSKGGIMHFIGNRTEEEG